MFRFGTLHFKPSLRGVVPIAAAIFVLLVAGAEALVRVPEVQAQLLLPALPGHYELGPKLYLADRLYATNGRIDCFFIGSSVIGRSVIPEDFSAAYQAQTHKPITCFNFGLDTLTFTGARNLTQILIRRYHPRLIIFGVHFISFTTSPANTFDLDTAWARYQLGTFSPEGWLESNLLIYRDSQTVTQAADDLNISRILTSVLSPYGYYSSDAIADDHRIKPRDNPEFFTVLDSINLVEHRPALDELLAAGTGQTQLVVVDVPLSAETARAVIHFGYDYQGYLNTILSDTQANHILYIPVAPPSLIPDEGYQDDIHMNSTGANLFSTWLGRRIAQAVKAGRIH